MIKKWILLFCCYLMIHVQLIAQDAPAFWSDIVAFKKLDVLKQPDLQSILFVGSSSFTKWQDVSEYFPGYPILNRGFGGSTLLDVIRYAYDIILPYQPKQVIIYCGENDLASEAHPNPEEVLLRVKTLFNIIRTNLPNTNISYVSIKPSPVRASIQEQVKASNQLIKSFFKKQKNAAFIDIYDAMLDKQGQMREEIYLSDRLHMKPAGYQIWKKAIQPFLLH